MYDERTRKKKCIFSKKRSVYKFVIASYIKTVSLIMYVCENNECCTSKEIHNNYNMVKQQPDDDECYTINK
jgi:hypothetical protein